MFTAPDGTSMITAGLDGWFDPAQSSDLRTEEFRVGEWRLEHNLKVAELRLPPDYRTPRTGQEQRPNLALDIPSLLFPLWHFCPRTSCRALIEIKPHHGKRRRCPVCSRRNESSGAKAKGKGKPFAPFLVQVPFVAMCEAGHLEDFPWREWVHRNPTQRCERQMYLKATGGATLAAQTVHCDCGVPPRNLSRITEAFMAASGEQETVLSSTLSPTDRYLCRGRRPWVDDRVGEGCGLPIRGSLRASTAAYFAHVESAIYLPGGSLGLPDGLAEALDKAPLKYTIDALRQFAEVTVDKVRQSDHQKQVAGFSDSDLENALGALEAGKEQAANPASVSATQEDIRRPEFDMLREELVSQDLKITVQNLEMFSDRLGRFLARVNLVDQLRETRVMYGFSRIAPNLDRPLPELKRQLWDEEPDFGASWLPAYVVRGEGLFVEFNPEAIAAWERRAEVQARVAVLARHPDRRRVHTSLDDPSLVPRFVLLHTFAHLMINQLVFECGYSSASLRERLFCAGGEKPMAGFLIYTAAGDSEGTMGGLVRMGKPGKLEPAIVAALDRAQWCSSDPVCMELGERGQGPRSTNLAACHACGLLPETACEVFNMFLDRAMVTGTHDDPSIGFLSNL